MVVISQLFVLVGVNTNGLRSATVSEEEPDEQDEGGVGTAVLALIVGLLVPIFFNSFVWGQDTVVFVLVLVAFAGALFYGSSMLNMTGGVSLGVGVVMASTAAMSWWLAGVGTAVAALALARYAYADQALTQREAEGLEPQTPTA